MPVQTMMLPEPTDVGMLGVCGLKRQWFLSISHREGPSSRSSSELHLGHVIFDALGIGLEQTLQYLFRTTPSFEQFEQWIVETAGTPSETQRARINAIVSGSDYPMHVQHWLSDVEASEPVLSAEDLAFWETNGYVIVHDAVSETSRLAAKQAVLDFVGATEDDAESWYQPNDHGIMVQYFQHPAFTNNRQSRRIHKAFAQLWNTADLWVSADRVGFNVPERPHFMFRGPDLHWDVSLERPIPFGTQGILYLTDTEPEQGAFTLVPGFQHRLDEWLDSLPSGAKPREQNLHALGSKPIAGRAGDLIIWHHALPHGSRPNRATRPRIVQYINMRPAHQEIRENWI